MVRRYFPVMNSLAFYTRDQLPIFPGVLPGLPCLHHTHLFDGLNSHGWSTWKVCSNTGNFISKQQGRNSFLFRKEPAKTIGFALLCSHLAIILLDASQMISVRFHWWSPASNQSSIATDQKFVPCLSGQDRIHPLKPFSNKGLYWQWSVNPPGIAAVICNCLWWIWHSDKVVLLWKKAWQDESQFSCFALSCYHTRSARLQYGFLSMKDRFNITETKEWIKIKMSDDALLFLHSIKLAGLFYPSIRSAKFFLVSFVASLVCCHHLVNATGGFITVFISRKNSEAYAGLSVR